MYVCMYVCMLCMYICIKALPRTDSSQSLTYGQTQTGLGICSPPPYITVEQFNLRV